MGCSSSNSSTLPHENTAAADKLEPQEIIAQRRRLSVDQVDLGAVKGTSQQPAPEEDFLDSSVDSSREEADTKKLLPARDPVKTIQEEPAVNQKQAEKEEGQTDIAEDDIAHIVSKQYGKHVRRFSIGTMTDQGRTSFANKSTEVMGDNENITSCGIGFTCRKGLKPESPNQDSWGVLEVDGDFSIYGVYDGHGQKGHDISNYVKDIMPKLIVTDQRFRTSQMSTMLVDIFKHTQDLIKTADKEKSLYAQMSGTTATVAVHDRLASKLTISHVADSTGVLATYTDHSHKELRARQLTRDHKPDLPDERERIVAAGGRVVFDGYSNHRVYAKNARYPGLNMSRCLGDLLGHADAGCSCIPEVSELPITPEDHMLILCSDGVWEFITPQEAVDIVARFEPQSATQAAELLAQESWNRWIKEEGGTIVDDITVLLVYLQSSGRGSASR